MATARFLRNLSPMPHANDPGGLTCDTIEKAVRCHDNLPIGKVGEFGKNTTRLGKLLKPA
jgi:hypothetical protein